MTASADKGGIKGKLDLFFGQNEFVPPPEAPVFEPTWDEFKDPAAYIEKIRDVGERAGICKIKPPPSWQPPFAIDTETFRFKPRLQKINELEARSRMKLNFVDRLLKFWHLQGLSLKVPVVEKQPLDLFKLHKAVSEEGGFEFVCNERKWSKVAERLGYGHNGKGVGSALRHHYERILYPYDLFTVGASVPGPKVKIEVKESPSPIKVEPESKKTKSGAKKNGKSLTHEPVVVAEKTADQYFCEVCEAGDNDELMLLCDGCDDAYHTYCLRPALSEIPPGDWRCPRCISKECAKKPEAYGFEEAANTYSLYSFGAKADQFKLEYFKKSGQLVPTSVVEKEFWRLVNCLDEDVIVEYGADLHALELGSGFPTEATKHRFPGYEEYIKCGWNLNNLPVLNTSVLRYIDADISGMKVPWCYVGMCFSCFCWHTEDHWSYSVNYMHWGEPKTWYGVPGSAAELLEECMQKSAGELFEQDPGLLHQLTTIINPNILMAYGVPIVRTDQCAGEFVITFPRSYHAGFNQGYNFAEAVNYCPSDWLPFGRGCVDHYRSVSRQCVFSQDELMFLITASSLKLDIDLAVVVAEDLTAVIEHEKNLRSDLLSQGLTEMMQVEFEKLTDDERECSQCQTTLFLSAVECHCKPKILRCIDHKGPPCECKPSKWKLLYRHTIEELDATLAAVKQRAECLPRWTQRVNDALNSTPNNRVEWKEVKALVTEAMETKIPAASDLLRKLNNIVHEAEECVLVAGHFTRCITGGGQTTKLSLDEVKSYCIRVDAIPCRIPEADPIKELLRDVEACQMEAKAAAVAVRLPSAAKLKQLIDRSAPLCVEIVECKPLRWLLEQATWLDDVEHSINDRTRTTLDALYRLIDGGAKLEKSVVDGLMPVHATCIAALGRLKTQLAAAEEVQQQATALLAPGCRPDVVRVKSAISSCDALAVHLPCADSLRSILQSANMWTTSVEAALRKDHGVHVNELERFIHEGCNIAITSSLQQQLETKMANIQIWKDQLMMNFHLRTPTDSLIQALFPLVDHATCATELKSRHLDGVFGDASYGGCCPDLALHELLKILESKSVDVMRKKRADNRQKSEEWDYSTANVAAVVFPKTAEDCKSRNICLLCLNSFAVDAVSLLTAVSSHMDTKFFCQSCRQCWPKRPPLATAAELISTCAALRVCLPAGKVLTWLAQRAANWKKSARLVLVSEQLAPLAVGSTTANDMAAVSDKMQHQLEELLVEGMILGVELEETDDICRLLLICHQQGCRRRCSPPKMDAAEMEIESPKAVVDKEKKKRATASTKRKLSGDDAAADHDGVQVTKKEQPVKDKSPNDKKIMHANGNTNNGNAKKSGGDEAKKRCRRPSGNGSARKKTATAGGSKVVEKTLDSGSSEDTDDDKTSDKFDTCSAKKCRRPTGKKIDWVQCDGCELWFHMRCVGLSPDQVSDDDDEQYHCDECSSRRCSPSLAAASLPLPANPASTSPPPRLSPLHTATAGMAQAAKCIAARSPPAMASVPPPTIRSSTMGNGNTATAVKDARNRSSAGRTSSTMQASSFAAVGVIGSSLRLGDCIEPSGTAVAARGVAASSSWSSLAARGVETATTGRSLAGDAATSPQSSYTFGQFLYTPWLTSNSLTPR